MQDLILGYLVWGQTHEVKMIEQVLPFCLGLRIYLIPTAPFPGDSLALSQFSTPKVSRCTESHGRGQRCHQTSRSSIQVLPASL